MRIKPLMLVRVRCSSTCGSCFSAWRSAQEVTSSCTIEIAYRVAFVSRYRLH
ncbi:hypothetical protein M5X17_07145 [Paenibacillus alvei]|uniref:Uncharacterized protein n=1 Tax=Paenibacillus alvei TaxID=44250 RepID=A0ABT4H1Z7_PAEAL|nr:MULTISPECIES: hypothetical protein [Paenibacillus]MCY7484793.1 hypothetical protein [Paenibacillus alvei]MCY9542347.1 hypothetical protein [Paenibacillus alvei]MCY9733533.1 hypothetical protein [Paenibacillus alvei]MCY9762998.1 hypothetical protein [Paenibacillus alvei]MCY9766132.1 hypothetical protein [Paenibacillus alvei]